MQNAIIIHAIITILHNTCVPELWKAVAQPEENHGESGSQNGSRKITSADLMSQTAQSHRQAL